MSELQSKMLVGCALAAVGLLGVLVLRTPAPAEPTYAERQMESADSALQDHYRLMCETVGQDCEKVDD